MSVGLNHELQCSLPVHLGYGLISVGGLVPTQLSIADDPTRKKAVRPPCILLLPWMLDGAEVDVQELCFQLDQFWSASGADPFELSGLPSFDELRTDEVSPFWPRSLSEASRILLRNVWRRSCAESRGWKFRPFRLVMKSFHVLLLRHLKHVLCRMKAETCLVNFMLLSFFFLTVGRFRRIGSRLSKCLNARVISICIQVRKA